VVDFKGCILILKDEKIILKKEKKQGKKQE
jgi:hypothetical protein